MKEDFPATVPPEIDYDELLEPVGYDFGLRRRSFVQILSAGILIATAASPAFAQNRGRRGGFGGGGPKNLGARIHLGKDGSITVLTGKVEAGQGSRAEITQASAEELHVQPERIQLIMADTGECPDDGITAGSGSTPRTVPAIRQAAAAARQLLIEFASKEWSVDPDSCKVENGSVTSTSSKKTLTYANLASNDVWTSASAKPLPSDITVTPVKEWKVLGKPVPRSNGRDIISGGHKFPSDINRPGMLYGKILRPSSYGAKLTSIDLAPAKEIKGVVVVRDDDFVGVAAPTTFLAEQALFALAKAAKWDTSPHPSSKELFDYLQKHTQGGVPSNPFSDEMSAAKHALKQTYNIAYVQHSPLEPRAAVAEWSNGKLTVWTGTQNPFGNRSELARAFHLADDQVRVIVPDFGAGFGGKHTGEAAVEAARLAKAAGKPVSLRWTREEEFTWAYFRPAGVILAEASLDAKGSLTSWHFININSGGSAVETPYRAGKNKSQYLNSSPPLRHGSYRALASTANNFARESFMDELAAAAGADPLDFRLAHLDNSRLQAVLEKATAQFNWKQRVAKKSPNTGVGLACGTEKGSYVAACVEIEIDSSKKISVARVCQAYECGAILNPDNLLKQVQGAIIMGLGPALREEMRFENGQILNASFRKYQVPRFDDVPELDIHLVDRPDLPSVGAGETPIITVAPAIANAVFHATGQRIRSMPIRLA
jgi:isoquinoline 1-oxidoreductase